MVLVGLKQNVSHRHPQTWKKFPWKLGLVSTGVQNLNFSQNHDCGNNSAQTEASPGFAVFCCVQAKEWGGVGQT